MDFKDLYLDLRLQTPNHKVPLTLKVTSFPEEIAKITDEKFIYKITDNCHHRIYGFWMSGK
jgi:hypothetical protein